MGAETKDTDYWHLNSIKDFDLNCSVNEGEFQLHGVSTADILVTRIVHCLWRSIAEDTREPLPRTNPLGNFEENKKFYARSIYHALIEYLDRYVGSSDFREVSRLEAQHMTQLKRRLEAETLIKGMGIAKCNSRARLAHLRSTLLLSSPQLLEILTEIYAGLKAWNADFKDSETNIDSGSFILERSVADLIYETKRLHEQGNIKTSKARNSSTLIRARGGDERLEVLVAMCSHLLDSNERLTSIFSDVKQRKRRDQIIKACFRFR